MASIQPLKPSILSFCFLFSSLVAHAQVDLIPDSLNASKNKIIPEKLKEATIFALKHYPELLDTPIEFKFTDNITTSFMQAQPKFGGLFRSKKKRGYIIKITPALKLQNENIPVEDLPFDVLVGWIGHELGHILDYKERSGIGMMRFGFGYVFSGKYKTAAERRADMNAIGHFLGQNIYATKQFIMDHAHIPIAYKEHIQKYYMSPEQVMEIIQKADVKKEDDLEDN